MFVDRKYRLARIWSNRELQKFASLFSGDIANVSAWRDEDKEGKHYRDYFVNAKSYTLTNFKEEARGYQGLEGEIFLDLTATLPGGLENRFDVVFNHTVLEHIYEVKEAFHNLCCMSKDIVILVVPFLQQMHTKYGDYWRFTPLTLQRLFDENGMSLMYCTFNKHRMASVYLFAIASKFPVKWSNAVPCEVSHVDPRKPMDGLESFVGCHAIPNPFYALKHGAGRLLRTLSLRGK